MLAFRSDFQISSFFLDSIEEDFVTWKEGFWPSLCQKLGIEASTEEISFRGYTLTVHEDRKALEEAGTIYTGEIARLKSYVNQRP